MKRFKEVKDAKNPYPSVSDTNPVVYNDVVDIDHLNDVLDYLSSRPYLTIDLAVNAFRFALNSVGISLPRLDIEAQVQGADFLSALTQLATGVVPNTNPTHECEYLFKIIDSDKNQDVNEHEPEAGDWDNHLHLYICIDRDESNKYWDAYCQVVDKSDIDTLLNMDSPEVAKEFPEMFDDHKDIDIGFHGEKDDG